MRGVQQEVLQPGKVEVSHFIETPALQFLLRSRLCETTRLQHNSECKKYSKQSNVTLLFYAFLPLFSFSSVPLQNTNLSESTTVKVLYSVWKIQDWLNARNFGDGAIAKSSLRNFRFKRNRWCNDCVYLNMPCRWWLQTSCNTKISNFRFLVEIVNIVCRNGKKKERCIIVYFPNI